MDTKEFDVFLQDTYRAELEHFQERAKQNERTYKLIQWATIILSALAAIFVGTEQIVTWGVMKFLAFSTSVVVSCLATGLKTFDYEKKSIEYNKAVMDLQEEYILYMSHRGAYVEARDKEGLFVENVVKIIKERKSAVSHPTLRKGRKPPPS